MQEYQCQEREHSYFKVDITFVPWTCIYFKLCFSNPKQVISHIALSNGMDTLPCEYFALSMNFAQPWPEKIILSTFNKHNSFSNHCLTCCSSKNWIQDLWIVGQEPLVNTVPYLKIFLMKKTTTTVNRFKKKTLSSFSLGCSPVVNSRRPGTAMSTRTGRETPMRMTPCSDTDM